MDRAGSSNDAAGTSDVPSSNGRKLDTVVQSHQSSSGKGVRKRHQEAESAYF